MPPRFRICCCLGSLLWLVSTAAAEPPPFSVGMVISLTGTAADYGQAVRAGVELALEDDPSAAAKVRFVYEDAGYDATRAISAFHKLVGEDKVAIVYAWGVVFCQTLAPQAESRHVPLVAQCVADNVSKDQSYVIRFLNYTDQYMRMQVRDLTKRGKKKLGIIAADNAYSQALLDALRRNLSKEQSIVLLDRQLLSEMDFRTFIRRAKSAGIDSLGVFLLMGQVSSFYKQMREQRFEIDTFGTNLLESHSELAASRGAMDGARFVNNAVLPQFEKRLEAKLGRMTQQGFSAAAYEFASLVLDLVEGGVKSGDELLQAMRKVQQRSGKAVGSLGYRDDAEGGHYFDLPLAVKEVVNGRVAELR